MTPLRDPLPSTAPECAYRGADMDVQVTTDEERRRMLVRRWHHGGPRATTGAAHLPVTPTPPSPHQMAIWCR